MTIDLTDLVDNSRETLDIELKQWLDLSDNVNRANLARHMGALCNHGGGYLVFGFCDDASIDPNRTASLQAYSHDAINGIVKRYLAPSFDCHVAGVESSAGVEYRIVRVPGHGTTPVCAQRDGPQDNKGKLEDVRRRLARQRDQLEQAFDADDRRSATEEARRLRHEIARMLHRPEHRGAVLSRQLAELKGAFNYRAREIADADAARRFDELAGKAVLELARGRAGFDTAEQQLEEMHRIMIGALWRDPRFVAEAFNSLAEEGHLALDPKRHGQLVAAGRNALTRGDIDGLRDLAFENDRQPLRGAAGSGATAGLATIMRA